MSVQVNLVTNGLGETVEHWFPDDINDICEVNDEFGVAVTSSILDGIITLHKVGPLSVGASVEIDVTDYNIDLEYTLLAVASLSSTNTNIALVALDYGESFYGHSLHVFGFDASDWTLKDHQSIGHDVGYNDVPGLNESSLQLRVNDDGLVVGIAITRETFST